MKNNKKLSTSEKLLNKLYANDPEGLKAHDDCIAEHSSLLAEYRKENNVPDFQDKDEYYAWLETPEGKKYAKKIEEVESYTNKKYLRGGARKGAGRPKLNKTNINNRVTKEAKQTFEQYAELYNVTQSQLLEAMITKGLESLTPKQLGLS